MLTRESLAAAVGRPLGMSDWIEIGQGRIDAFAELTEDRQPIHLDPAAGRAAGFDGTVAHGFLTLSMLSALSYDALPQIAGARASVNYGFDRLRFVSPVPGGARIRAHFILGEAAPRAGGEMLRLDVDVEVEGQAKPALTAQWLVLFLF